MVFPTLIFAACALAVALSANMIKAITPAAAVTFIKFDIRLLLKVRIHFLLLPHPATRSC
jgi:hypothetical protein